ncbi:hypothetical protein N9383_00050 [Granulosicoccus sp.]|nr:hypothetical protein [Granulosicoccus sp.]
MKIIAERVSELPRLAWLARINLNSHLINVLHGDFVESGDNHVVEGCWNGRFENRDFDQSETFFGSGLRCRENHVVLVPSRSLTDRVLLAISPQTTLASNSLPLILAGMNCKLDLAIDYRPACHAILAGIRKYSRNIATTSQNYCLEQVFYRPIQLNASERTHISEAPEKRFAQYENYESELRDTLDQLHTNCQSSARRVPVASWSALSTGYDSCATAALAAEQGISKSYITAGGRTLDGLELEDSRPIADALKLDARIMQPKIPSAEVERLCLAATYDGRESIFSTMFDDALEDNAAGCLWSGYHGDKIWDRASAEKYLSNELLRGDTSGLNLSEVRLSAGFFNLAVPFIFARSIRDIVRIANSAQMAEWQVGGNYDRPIPRRIAETRGVPRSLFGIEKKAAMEYYKGTRNTSLQMEYVKWLQQNNVSTIRRSVSCFIEEFQYRTRRLNALGRYTQKLRLRFDPTSTDNLQYLWAVNSCVQKYVKNESVLAFIDS